MIPGACLVDWNRQLLTPLPALPPHLQPELRDGRVGEAGPLHQVRGLRLPLRLRLKVRGSGLAYLHLCTYMGCESIIQKSIGTTHSMQAKHLKKMAADGNLGLHKKLDKKAKLSFLNLGSFKSAEINQDKSGNEKK